MGVGQSTEYVLPDPRERILMNEDWKGPNRNLGNAASGITWPNSNMHFRPDLSWDNPVTVIRRTLLPDNLSDVESAALDTLRKDDNIIILPVDKGTKAIIVDKTDHIQSEAAVKRYYHLPPGGYGSNNETGNKNQQNLEEAAGYAKNNQGGTVEDESWCL